MSKKGRFDVRYEGTGFRGYPIGTICYYGPDERTVRKIVVSVIRAENEEPSAMKTWVGRNIDSDKGIREEIDVFLSRNSVRSIVRSEAPIGCIHEEGEDFRVGEDCPFCPAWRGKQTE